MSGALSMTQREQAAARRFPGAYVGLTFQQAELLSFIRDRAANGVTPSLEEMKDAVGLKARSGVHKLVSSLVERGYVSRLPNRARAIWPVAMPEPPVEKTLSLATTAELVAEMKNRGFTFRGRWA